MRYRDDGIALLEHGSPSDDPRRSRKLAYPQPKLVLVLPYGTLAGRRNFVEITHWAARDVGVLLMGSLFGLLQFLLKLCADSGYQGSKFQARLRGACRRINLAIVIRSELSKFVALPKRCMVERPIGWLNRCPRLAKDWKWLNQNGLAFLRWASIRMMVRKVRQRVE